MKTLTKWLLRSLLLLIIFLKISIAQNGIDSTNIKDTVYNNLMIKQRSIEINNTEQDMEDIQYSLEAIDYYLEQINKYYTKEDTLDDE